MPTALPLLLTYKATVHRMGSIGKLIKINGIWNRRLSDFSVFCSIARDQPTKAYNERLPSGVALMENLWGPTIAIDSHLTSCSFNQNAH